MMTDFSVSVGKNRDNRPATKLAQKKYANPANVTNIVAKTILATIFLFDIEYLLSLFY